ncbi:hypothetical protein [Paraburkholderia youngii]|uniref:hypothetical protein n=1 Tax=Paraburkholderia youngii TaxID=2782701 RepID=UPI003D1EE60B
MEFVAPPKNGTPRADPVWIVHGENDDVCTMHRRNCEGAALLADAALARRAGRARSVPRGYLCCGVRGPDNGAYCARLFRSNIWSETRGFF